ncbi:hypothetical protein [Deinococcus aquaticus]|uniref:hypothetical protein n=1 Tax=Deinococcus aquaticus TaxID=328692 RepID=UPI003609EB58
MKAILLKGDGDFELKIEADFSNSLTGEAGDVRVQAEGIDVDTREDFPLPWYTAGSVLLRLAKSPRP